jgi:glycerophosphoryl diester phosphodiesterase
MPSRPLIIAHRGSSSIAPENTMAAFKRAVDCGADGIEFDVRLSRDGVPVVIHDADLRRVGARVDQVSSLTATELGQCDVGSWFNRRFPALANHDFAAEGVPTLDKFLTFARGVAGIFYLELKPSIGQESMLAFEVAKLIKTHQLESRIVALSFDLTIVKALKELNSSIRTAALFQPQFLRPGSPLRKGAMIRTALACNADEIAVHRLLLTPGMARRAVSAGLKVVVWTVDDPAWFITGSRLGVDAIITNQPEEMILSRKAVLASL